MRAREQGSSALSRSGSGRDARLTICRLDEIPDGGARGFTVETASGVRDILMDYIKPTGIRPKFVEKFEVQGIHLPPGTFGSSY